MTTLEVNVHSELMNYEREREREERDREREERVRKREGEEREREREKEKENLQYSLLVFRARGLSKASERHSDRPGRCID